MPAYLQYALSGDSLCDRTGDALGGVDESLLGGHTLFDISTEKALYDGVDSS